MAGAGIEEVEKQICRYTDASIFGDSLKIRRYIKDLGSIKLMAGDVMAGLSRFQRMTSWRVISFAKVMKEGFFLSIDD